MSAKTLKTLIIGIVVVAVIAIGVVFASRLEKIWESPPEGAGTSTAIRQNENTAGDIADGPVTVSFDGQEYLLKDELSTLLIIGTDDDVADEDVGNFVDSQADFLLLAVFNDAEKTCTLLQVDRNTMTNVQIMDESGASTGTAFEQLCLAHDYGGSPEARCANTIAALSSLLFDTPIENYLSLSMGGVSALNDAVGGVTVTIEDDFSGVDDTLVQGETVRLMGEHAYNFVHSRYGMSDDANTSRMRRQREYMVGLVKQLRGKVDNDAGFALELFTTLADYLVTDCAVDQLADYSEVLSDYELTEILTLEGEVSHTGAFTEFYPDMEALQQMVLELFYVPYEPAEAE